MLRGPVFLFNLLKQIFSVALFQFYSKAALEKIITKLTCLEKQDIMLWSPSSYWTLHSQNLFCISLILSKVRVIFQFYEKGRKKYHQFACIHVTCQVTFIFVFHFCTRSKGLCVRWGVVVREEWMKAKKKGYCEKMLSHLWKILVTWHLLYVYCTYCVYLLYLLMSFMY